MAKQDHGAPQPRRVVSVAEPVLDEILQELRAIRTALEHPKDTALKEIRNAEYPEDAMEERGHKI
jgi:hypothetical protein